MPNAPKYIGSEVAAAGATVILSFLLDKLWDFKVRATDQVSSRGKKSGDPFNGRTQTRLASDNLLDGCNVMLGKAVLDAAVL
jgi:hypothetical protein